MRYFSKQINWFKKIALSWIYKKNSKPMIDQYFQSQENETKYVFRFINVSNTKNIDNSLLENLKETIILSYRNINFYKLHLEGSTVDEIKKYVVDYVIPGNKNQLDLNVRQGDWGEILSTLIITYFQDLEVPINKLQWKLNKDKSVFGTDLIAFNKGENIKDIYYYEIKTRLTSHLKEGTNPHRNYVSIVAHNSLLKDENTPNEMIADFLMRLYESRENYVMAKKFSDIVKNPKNYNRNFELFFIVEELNYSENIFDELNSLPPQLSPLRVTVIIIKDLQNLINETWLDIENKLVKILKAK